MENILLAGTGVIVGALGWFIKNKITWLDKRVENADARSDGIEKNYIKEFQRVRAEISQNELNAERRHNELQLLMIDKFVKKKDCQFQHSTEG
jgi:hypothetical protein